jgi:hypothetical protein
MTPPYQHCFALSPIRIKWWKRIRYEDGQLVGCVSVVVCDHSSMNLIASVSLLPLLVLFRMKTKLLINLLKG